jgi:ATP-dependent helicase HrpB
MMAPRSFPIDPLPIDPLLPEIIDSVTREPVVLLEAEPGAGKTTRVPAALLAAGFADICVLEPRRLAARMAARRVAEEMGQPPGQQVGYQVRYEEISSDQTRLWFMTEGVLTRRLLSDRLLERVQVVVLDEFHERHLETDLALALSRKLQEQRNDLRVVIMSATLGGEKLAEQLRGAAVIKAPGRLFPVAIEYTPHSAAPLEQQVATAVGKILTARQGHTLVFLPGAAEIRRAITACEPLGRQAGALLLPLHGDLSPEEQDAAVGPSRQRKVICSTNVAESSITIDGVDAVVDSGVARVLSHSPWSGLSRLQIEKVSQASAIQRAGRAGRTRPGIAMRLYPESDFVRRPQSVAPEILRADLAQLTLQLAVFGIRWDDLTWLDESALELRQQASALLERLGLLEGNSRATHLGQSAGRLPLHPRLARFLLAAVEFGAGREASELAARLSEGRFRLDESRRGKFVSDVDAVLAEGASYPVRRLQSQLSASIPRTKPNPQSRGLEKALLFGFPDRVARRRGEVCLLSNGASAKLDRASAITSEFLAAIDIEDRTDQPVVRLAAPIEPDWLLDFFPDHVKAYEEVVWNREAERVEQINGLRYDEVTIDESRSSPTDLNAAAELLTAKALEAGAERFTDGEELAQFLRRIEFAHQHGDFDKPAGLVASAVRQLAEGATGLSDLRSAARNGGLIAIMQALLPMPQIDEIAPTHMTLPSGRRARIEYHQGRPPSVSSRLQDFFGMRETPTVARGKVPLVVQLLAPNHRPVQVTTDLVSFWKNLYPQLRRELGRRYPKHSWPENPI